MITLENAQGKTQYITIFRKQLHALNMMQTFRLFTLKETTCMKTDNLAALTDNTYFT